jgi:putative SOS response-associated peptidase YedK
MCGRFVVAQTKFKRIERKLKTHFPEVTPRYNIAPAQQISVIHQVDENFVMSEMKWGLVPSWSKTPTTTYSTFNAKLETAAEKPAYRSAFKHRRCLIPASGFYEWQREGNYKQPYYFTLADGEEMALAGLWEQWKDSSGAMLNTCTIIVGAPNSLIGKIHNRMATIVPENLYEDWLNPNENTDYLIAMLTVPYLADKMKMWKVNTDVNSVRNQGAELIKPLPYSAWTQQRDSNEERRSKQITQRHERRS